MKVISEMEHRNNNPEDWGTHVLDPIYGIIIEILPLVAIYGTGILKN
jgi:hypothetical protein